MPLFVHLTSATRVNRIRRSGITIPRGRAGVYCMPVLPDYYITHQWVRELRRFGPRLLVAVHFRLGDDEPVWVGPYARAHDRLRAVEAVQAMREADDAHGYEVIVPRTVLPGEVRRIRSVPQVVGWRFMPYSHLRRPCTCSSCMRGKINARRVVRRAEELARRRAREAAPANRA